MPRELFANATFMLFIAAAPAFLVLSYVMLRWQAHREESEDDQIGLKVVLAFVMLVSLGFAAQGLTSVIHFIVSGFDTGTKSLLEGLVTAIVFGGVVAGLWLTIVPRTNLAEYPRISRYALGYVAALGGLSALIGLRTFVSVVGAATWTSSSPGLATLLVYGGLGAFGLFRFGALAGWKAPVKAAPMPVPGAYPTQPQQQAAYPPQQQQAAYPPAGGYPPPGSYPPGGGNPHGGGGFSPPQGGGGFPPAQGGGGGLPPPGGYNR